jgi:hypothetical protein
MKSSRASTGIGWPWMVPLPRLPWEGKKTGPSPVGRGKGGVKRRLLTEASGIPLAVEVAPANRHDMKLVAATLVQMMCASPVEAKVSR